MEVRVKFITNGTPDEKCTEKVRDFAKVVGTKGYRENLQKYELKTYCLPITGFSSILSLDRNFRKAYLFFKLSHLGM